MPGTLHGQRLVLADDGNFTGRLGRRDVQQTVHENANGQREERRNDAGFGKGELSRFHTLATVAVAVAFVRMMGRG